MNMPVDNDAVKRACSKEHWEGKRVLVTGADGFMGSHLTEKLLEMGSEVYVFVRGTSTVGTSRMDLRNISHLKDRLAGIIAGDISKKDAINLMRQTDAQVIFHLAADAYVPNSFKKPIEVMEVNLTGTLNVLHAAMEMDSIEQIVCTSSSEIYGTHTNPIHEKNELRPTSPYGASKAAADRYCFAYYTTYGLPIAIIRPFNTYGPRHTYDVIPKFIELALKNETLTIYGEGNQTRDFSYVDDMITAFLIMGSSKRAVGEAVNFGTGVDVTIKNIAEKIVQHSCSESKVIHVEPRMSEVTRLCSDPSKAERLFGWKSRIMIDEGLKRNIDWAKAQAR